MLSMRFASTLVVLMVPGAAEQMLVVPLPVVLAAPMQWTPVLEVTGNDLPNAHEPSAKLINAAPHAAVQGSIAFYFADASA